MSSSFYPHLNITHKASLAKDVFFFITAEDSMLAVVGGNVVIAAMAVDTVGSARLHNFFCEIMFLESSSTEQPSRCLFVVLFAFLLEFLVFVTIVRRRSGSSLLLWRVGAAVVGRVQAGPFFGNGVGLVVVRLSAREVTAGPHRHGP